MYGTSQGHRTRCVFYFRYIFHIPSTQICHTHACVWPTRQTLVVLVSCVSLRLIVSDLALVHLRVQQILSGPRLRPGDQAAPPTTATAATNRRYAPHFDAPVTRLNSSNRNDHCDATIQTVAVRCLLSSGSAGTPTIDSPYSGVHAISTVRVTDCVDGS